MYWDKKEKEIFSTLKRQLQEKYRNAVKEIRVFGSRARGEQTPESDIDIMVLLDMPVDWRIKKEIHSLLAEIDLEYDVILSARIFSVDQWQSPLFRITPLFKSIEREGVLV